jgi:hypothetical protein
MKQIISFATLLILTGCFLSGYPQGVPTYPIPSYNIAISTYANFREGLQTTHTDQLRGKRQINVQVRSGSDADNCQATVWVYSLDRITILGPYTVPCGITLTVDIDEREWGVMVECEQGVIADVWISEGSNMSSIDDYRKHVILNHWL